MKAAKKAWKAKRADRSAVAVQDNQEESDNRDRAIEILPAGKYRCGVHRMAAEKEDRDERAGQSIPEDRDNQGDQDNRDRVEDPAR